MPKSIRIAVSPFAIITFAGLRSRCTTPASCAAAMPAAIWRASASARSSRAPTRRHTPGSGRRPVLPRPHSRRTPSPILRLLDEHDVLEADRRGLGVGAAHLVDRALEREVAVAAAARGGELVELTGR